MLNQPPHWPLFNDAAHSCLKPSILLCPSEWSRGPWAAANSHVSALQPSYSLKPLESYSSSVLLSVSCPGWTGHSWGCSFSRARSGSWRWRSKVKEYEKTQHWIEEMGEKVLKTEVLLLQRLMLKLYFCWPLKGTRGGLRYVRFRYVKECILISVHLTAKSAVIILSI